MLTDIWASCSVFGSWLIGKTTNLTLVACHSSYRVPNRSCVNGFIGTRSRWAQFIVCLFDIDLYLSCLLAKKQIRVSVWAVLSLSPMASLVLLVGNHRVIWMFIPGHARLIHTLFGPQNEKTCLRGLPPSTIQTALLSYTGGKTWNFTYIWCWSDCADWQTGLHLKVCCSQIARTGFFVKYLSQFSALL